MNSLSEIPLNEFRQSLTPTLIRTGMLIQGALTAGALMFFSSVILLGLMHTPEDMAHVDEGLLATLTMVCAAFFAAAAFAGQTLYRRQFSVQALERAAKGEYLGSTQGKGEN